MSVIHKYTEKVDDMGLYDGNCPLEQNESLTFQVFSLQEENKDRSENPPPAYKCTGGRAAAVTPPCLGFPTVTEKDEENGWEGKEEKRD